MSVARTWAVALTGIEGTLVAVEADLSQQTPAFQIIGLPDKALGESAQRVHNACANCGLDLPRRKLTVNLSPASLPKRGSGFDVAIAVASLATELAMDRDAVAATVHIGELALDGRLRPVPGVLPAVRAAADAGISRVVVPHALREEAELVGGVEVLGAATLADVVRWHGADVAPLELAPFPAAPEEERAEEPVDLADVVGQPDAVDALVIAAVGGHHLLLSGPPGAGKTMLARRLPGILPPLDDEAALRVASVRSLGGHTVHTLSRTPPFEAPHHSTSTAALVGGGSRAARPGAIARASDGVLFIDEAGEASGSALDALRQPLESGRIEIHRVGFAVSFPARFQLVLATNPCPCGNFGVRGGVCSCAPAAIRRYRGRLSGPLRDRIDIELAMLRVASAGDGGSGGMSSAVARDRVREARDRAAHRLRDTPWRINAELPGTWLRRGPAEVAATARRPLDAALQRGALTLRGYDRVLRLAWSVADLAGRATPDLDDVGRALYLKRGVAA